MHASVEACPNRAKTLFGMVLAADQRMERPIGGPECGRMAGLC